MLEPLRLADRRGDLGAQGGDALGCGSAGVAARTREAGDRRIGPAQRCLVELALWHVVVALVDDDATIKELRRSKDAVVLMPRTKNKKHQPIVLRQDFQVQGVVVATLPDIDS